MFEDWLSRKMREFGEVLPYHRAALLHILAGRLTLQEIAEHSAMQPEVLSRHRLDPAFLVLLDSLKKDFSREFREILLERDFAPEGYDSLAVTFCMLDEMVQMQVKAPLIKNALDIAQRIKSRNVHGLRQDEHEILQFHRLFTFLTFTEAYITILTKKAVELLEQVESDVVWPFLDPAKTRERREIPTQAPDPSASRQKETGVLGSFLAIVSVSVPGDKGP